MCGHATILIIAPPAFTCAIMASAASAGEMKLPNPLVEAVWHASQAITKKDRADPTDLASAAAQRDEGV